MKNKFSKILTGYNFLDKNWAGVYPGGNYLIFGPRKTGKTLLLLKMLEHLANNNFTSLFISNERKKSLEIQAASVYFDIDEYVSNGIIKVENLKEKTSDFENFKELIRNTAPQFLFIDEITQFVNIKTPGEFNTEYLKFLELLEENDITTFITASALKLKNSKLIIQTVAKNSVGIIQIVPDKTTNNYSGTVMLKPNIGHIEGEFSALYKIEPINGFTVETKPDLSKIINKEIEHTSVTKLLNAQAFSYSNIYNIEDFKLILESKKSYVNNTGKLINVIEYSFDKELIKPEKFSEIVKKALSRADKISYTLNKLFILLSEKNSDRLKRVLTKLDNIVQLEFNRIDNIDEKLIRKTHILKNNFSIS